MLCFLTGRRSPQGAHRGIAVPARPAVVACLLLFLSCKVDRWSATANLPLKGSIMQALQLLFTSDYGLLTVAFFALLLAMVGVFLRIFSGKH